MDSPGKIIKAHTKTGFNSDPAGLQPDNQRQNLSAVTLKPKPPPVTDYPTKDDQRYFDNASNSINRSLTATLSPVLM